MKLKTHFSYLDKTKKSKRNSSGTLELNESSKEQENSSGSYTPPNNYSDNANHISMSELYQPFGGLKKRRRTSAPGCSSTAAVIIKEEPESQQQNSDIEQTVEEISVNGNDITVALNNHLYSQQPEKLNMSAFQLSTHFMPINGKVYEDFSNENSMSETPLNLAAGSH